MSPADHISQSLAWELAKIATWAESAGYTEAADSALAAIMADDAAELEALIPSDSRFVHAAQRVITCVNAARCAEWMCRAHGLQMADGYNCQLAARGDFTATLGVLLRYTRPQNHGFALGVALLHDKHAAAQLCVDSGALFSDAASVLCRADDVSRMAAAVHRAVAASECARDDLCRRLGLVAIEEWHWPCLAWAMNELPDTAAAGLIKRITQDCWAALTPDVTSVILSGMAATRVSWFAEAAPGVVPHECLELIQAAAARASLGSRAAERRVGLRPS